MLYKFSERKIFGKTHLSFLHNKEFFNLFHEYYFCSGYHLSYPYIINHKMSNQKKNTGL